MNKNIFGGYTGGCPDAVAEVIPPGTVAQFTVVPEGWETIGIATGLQASNTATPVYDLMADLAAPQQRAGVCTLSDGVHIFGGASAAGTHMSTHQRLDASTGLWSSKAALPAVRSQCIAIAVDSDTAVILGGTSGVAVSTVYRYKVSTGAMSSLPPMSVARYGFQAAKLGSGIILVHGNDGLSAQTEHVDIAAGTRVVITTDPRPAALSYGVSVSLPDGRAIAIAGWTGTAASMLCHYYDETVAAGSRWTPAPTLPASAGAAVHGAQGWYADGLVMLQTPGGILLALDPTAASPAWYEYSPAPRPHYWQQPALLPDGRVVFAGGYPTTATAPTAATIAMRPLAFNPAPVYNAVKL